MRQRACSPLCGRSVGAPKRQKRLAGVCAHCGEPTSFTPSQVKNGRKTCSRACMAALYRDSKAFAGPANPTWTGGDSNYWKRKARERDDFTCQYKGCGVRDEGTGTHAHHVVPQRFGGTDDLSNLVTVCVRHHLQVEHRARRRVLESVPRKTLRRLINDLYAFRYDEDRHAPR